MVFPLAQQLVGRVNQVYRQVSWELFAVILLNKSTLYTRFGRVGESLLFGYKSRIWPSWGPRIKYLTTWGNELHLRAAYLVRIYRPSDTVDLEVRDSVLLPEDRWAQLPEPVRLDWRNLPFPDVEP